ncbi:MAG: GNAT family N-acetyltransferase [Oligoflexia bacterium]|nr:GNAT family N-acetyltransferase [Oligoflexia bacterium]
MQIVEITDSFRMQQFSRLLDQAFQLAPGMHYLDDFPIWSAAGAGERSVIRLGAVSDEGDLMAGAGLRLASIRTLSGDAVRAALIGAVATGERFRGQGLATRLVAQALARARDAGAAVALLWGAEHSLYAKLGFTLCGSQILIPLQSLELPKAGGSLEKGWNPGIFDLLMKRGSGVILTPQDRVWIEAHRHVDWYWVGPRTAPDAYAAVGRGIDLGGLVHEWGGEPSALKALLGSLRAERPELTLLGSSRDVEKLGFSREKSRQEFLYLAAVLDPARIAPRVIQEEIWIWGLDAV